MDTDMNHLENLNVSGGDWPLARKDSSPSPKSSPPGRGLARFHRIGLETVNEVSNGRRAFTLIELLVVITIIGVLAALTLTTLNRVGRSKRISAATAEMKSLETAIGNYKAKYGVYPPGNGSNTFTAALYSPLYYELTGVSFANANNYNTVGGLVTVANMTNLFNVNGILNCTKGSGEDAVNSENFLPDLRPNQHATVWEGASSAEMLTTSVGGPDLAYAPIQTAGVNVFRYKQPDPTNNNPGSYDLWINLSIGATNANGGSSPNNLVLIANWNKNYQGGSTMP